MTLSEFEKKLRIVTEEKLRRMLEKSRGDGPEIAVQLILDEAARRGIPDLAGTHGNLRENAQAVRVVSPNAVAVENNQDAFDTAASANTREADHGESTGSGTEAENNTSIAQAEWMDEELAGSRSFTVLKVILYLGALAGGLYLLFQYTRR